MTERTPEARALLAEINQAGGQLASLLVNVRAFVEGGYVDARARGGMDAHADIVAADPERWADIGQNHLQQGLAALRRAVAMPKIF